MGSFPKLLQQKQQEGKSSHCKSKQRPFRKDLTKKQKELEALQNQIQETVDAIDTEKGPFEKDFDAVLDRMNLKRQVYHKGALVGNDVNKLMEQKNYTALCTIFKPRTLAIHGGGKASFGSHKQAQQVLTMFRKLSQAYDLYAPSRPLCKHEVEVLALRCASLGNWFPANRPRTSLKRKFHTLTHHVPAKARRLATVGMEAEHLAESIHPRTARFERATSTIQDM